MANAVCTRGEHPGPTTEHSIDESVICVVDDEGEVHFKTAVATDREATLQGGRF
jgi:hypothetical protein